LNRSIWVGACPARRLRRTMQAATARRASTAAVTPIPIPILAASVIPPGLECSEPLEVAAAPAAEEDVELLTTLVGTAVGFVDAEDSVDSADDVVDDSGAPDVVEVSGFEVVDSAGASVGASVVDGAGSVEVVASEVGTGAPGGSVAVAHIAAAAFVMSASDPGGQLFNAQSRISKRQLSTRHRQLKSIAAQANEPALFTAWV
jgi:hypothetical protein